MTDSQSATLYVGVDAGASKTHVVVLDANGTRVGETVGEAASLNGHAAQAWQTITEVIEQACADAGQASLAPAALAVQIGIAGTEISAAYNEFVTQAPAFAFLGVASDAEIACAGAHELADGAVVSIGTGVVGVAREGDTIRRAAGWGFPHDDRGGGAWLGMEAVHATLAAQDGRGERSALTDAVLGRFDDIDALVVWACAARAGDFARLARVVVDTAASGDAQADRLLRRAAGEVTIVINTLAPERPGAARGLPLALTGGLAASLRRYFDAMLRERLVAPRFEPAHGAALMARAGDSA